MLSGPLPPADVAALDPAAATLPAGSRLFRIHAESRQGHVFNPGRGAGGRFHFVDLPGGGRVPSLYAAATLRAAVAETLFHDVPLRPRSYRAIAIRKLNGRVLSRLRTRRPFSLVELHHPGLGRLGLKPEEITATDPSRYPGSRRWAQALHDHGGAFEGLVWMSRLHNTDRAFTFFGDRVAADDFEPLSAPMPLWSGPGLDLVYELAEASAITVVHS